MTLSILIAAKKENRKNLDVLIAILAPQMNGLHGQVHVDIESDDKMTVGEKMNSLLKDAIGKYVWMLEDTDIVSETAILDIFSCLAMEPDVVAITGASSFGGRNPCDWKQGLNEDRKPDHNNPMKLELARRIQFRKRKVNALAIWSREMNKMAPWAYEVEIEKPIIHKAHDIKHLTQTGN